MNESVLLINPPGWSLNVGAPHISLPLLQGYCLSKNIPCEIIDLNIWAAKHYDIDINANDVKNACKKLTLDSLNFPWYRVQDKMDKIASEYNGFWFVQNGFNFNNCDLSSSNDIKRFSKLSSPFASIYKKYLIPKIKKNKYKMIGLSVIIPSQLLSAFEIGRIIKESGYDGKLILGGNTITRLRKEMALDWIFKIFDILAFYPGEKTIESVWLAIQNKKKMEEIPNIAYNNNGNTLFTNTITFKNKYFTSPIFKGYPIGEYWGINTMPLLGSFGCYYHKCSFCSIPYSWGGNGFLGINKPESVVNAIIDNISQYKINRFSFAEEAMHPMFFKSFSEKIIERGIKISFEGYILLDNVWRDKKFIDTMRKAGLKKVFIGLEAISRKNRYLMGKINYHYDILEFLNIFYSYGIKVHLFFITGFPGTTINDSLDTMEFLLENKELIDTVDISPFALVKHSHVKNVKFYKKKEKDWALEYNYETDDHDLYSRDRIELFNNKLENLIAQEKPEWLHPIYRLYSPWGNAS